MRVVVGGMIATFPIGGVFWDYVQYAVGLERLGHEVWYLEDTGFPCYDVATAEYDWTGDWDRHAAYLGSALGAVSPTLGERWHLRADDGRSFGTPAPEMAQVLADADVFLNVSGMTILRSEYLPCRRKVLLDTDPGWNHWMRWPHGDTNPTPDDHGMRAHDRFATYAENIGRPACGLPDLGIEWQPTRPPVVLDLWDGGDAPQPDAAWTTVLSWSNAPLPITDGTTCYGTKERELPKVEDLPGELEVPLEMAVGGARPPVERWRAKGWRIVGSTSVSGTPDDYRRYLQRSRGELSVAKHVYVASRSGWFSCRSTCYLAAGRPVVVQDTGFSDVIPTGDGLLCFDDGPGAATAVRRAEADWDHHARAARELAATHFSPEVVLGELLDRVAS